MLPDGAQKVSHFLLVLLWHLAEAACRLAAVRTNVMALTFASPALQKAPPTRSFDIGSTCAVMLLPDLVSSFLFAFSQAGPGPTASLSRAACFAAAATGAASLTPFRHCGAVPLRRRLAAFCAAAPSPRERKWSLLQSLMFCDL